MPRMNGLELTGQLLRRYPDLKVLVLTRNDREDCVLRLVQAGAGGYLLKTVDRTDLLAACARWSAAAACCSRRRWRRCSTTTSSACASRPRGATRWSSPRASARSSS